ncbi:MAG: single-stranded DNA-binding protein [Angelakisella sp.]
MFNKAILIGRMTADPELKQTGSGIHVTGFSIAVDRKFSKDGERKADFLNITAWRQQAEFICKYFHKGDPIGIEGSIQTRNYEDKTGAKRTATEIQAENVFFVGGKGSSGGNAGNVQPAGGSVMAAAAPVAFSSGAASDFEEVETDDDLPF